ncbi:MAG: DNA polymerase III subunit delta' [Paraperlucidibaca sp.]
MLTDVYPWQQGIWASLNRLLVAERLPHAMLFAAPAGTGKRRLADAFAARMLCQSPVAENACGHCRGCQLLAAGTHPDYYVLSPEVDGDKVSKVIKIDQARAVVSFASQTAQMQGYRVIIIEPADALNTASANAMLKTLEEPGQRCVFLLLTDQPTALLATIRSRCQLLPLSMPSDDDALIWLRPQLSAPAMAETLLALARGAPLAALALSESPWFVQRQPILDALLAVGSGAEQPLSAASQFTKIAATEQITAWQSLLDDAVQQGFAPESPVRHSDLPALQKLAEINAQCLLETLWQAVEARRLLDDTNVAAATIVDNLWLHWARATRQGGHHVRR